MVQTVEPYDVAVLFWSPDDLAKDVYKRQPMNHACAGCGISVFSFETKLGA